MSFDFKRVSLNDWEVFVGIRPPERFLSCEYSFANLIAWGAGYSMGWTEWKGAPLIINGREDLFLFPLAAGVDGGDLAELSRDLRKSGYSGVFTQVPRPFVEGNPDIREWFDVRDNRDYADYIHSVKRLVELRGARLRKKKAQIRKFREERHDADVAPLGRGAFGGCLDLVRGSLDGSSSREEEFSALRRVFDNFEELRCGGVRVSIAGRVVAFSVFTPHLDGTCLVHFEKADLSIFGLSQLITWATAKSLAEVGCEFVNREQDLGMPGLRKAKKSYDPDYILDNYDLVPKAYGF